MKELLISILLALQINLLLAQDLYLVRNKAGLYGFANEHGDTVIPCKYEYAEPFSEGLALVKNNLRHKIIDSAGNLYDLNTYVPSSLFKHYLGDNNWGLPVLVPVWDCAFINSSGEVFLELPYTDAFSFQNGRALVINGDKYNFVSRNGILLNDKWQKIEDDFFAIKNEKGLYGYVDVYGNLVINYKFQQATDFKDGLAKISNGKMWAIIDKKGEKISDWYEKIEDFNGNVAIVYKLGNYGFIDRTGSFRGEWYKTIIPLDYGLYKVEKYASWAIVNKDGYLVTQWFEYVGDFKQGFLLVKKDGKFAYLNKIAALVIGWYDTLSPIINGIIRIVEKNKYAFYNVEEISMSKFYDYIGEFSEDLAVIKDGDKFGYINRFAKVVIKPQYDNAKSFKNGVAQVELNDKVAYINKKGEVILGWFPKKIFFEKEAPRGIYVVKYGDKYGFEDINGRTILSPRYDYAENFSEGLALVKTNPTKMYIDKHGNPVPITSRPDLNILRCDYGYGHSGKPVEITVWNCFYIDYNGNIVLSLDDFTDAQSFINNKAKVFKGDKYTYIDKKGKIIDKWYELPDQYHADYKGGKFGFLNKNGEVVIAHKFDYAEDFRNNRALVRFGDRATGKYALIDLTGKIVTKQYDFIDTSLIFNRLYLARINNKFLLIDTNGVEVSKQYDKIFPFNNNVALVMNNGKYSYINQFGQQFAPWFDEASHFSCNRAKVKILDKYGYINTKGEIVINPNYEFATDFNNNIAKVFKNGKYCFIDLNGRQVSDWYDQIFFFSEDRAVVVKDGKWGYIDLNGHLVIPTIYDRAFAFSNNVAIVIKDSKIYQIDKNGDIIKN